VVPDVYEEGGGLFERNRGWLSVMSGTLHT
jgi:hypothetical protein